MRIVNLHVEQEGSLVACLMGAGIENGDTVDLILDGVGIRTNNHGYQSVAFCPASVEDVRVLKRGSRDDRAKPIPYGVRFTNGLRRRILNEAPRHGFVRLHVQLHSSGVIELRGGITQVASAPLDFRVWDTDSYSRYRQIIIAQ